MNAFIKLGVIEPLAQALYQQGIRFPTAIQQASIPAIFKGKDIIGRSEKIGRASCRERVSSPV